MTEPTTDQVKRAANAAREATQALETAIVTAHADGASLRHLAASAGLTPEGIRLLLLRYGAVPRPVGRHRNPSKPIGA